MQARSGEVREKRGTLRVAKRAADCTLKRVKVMITSPSPFSIVFTQRSYVVVVVVVCATSDSDLIVFLVATELYAMNRKHRGKSSPPTTEREQPHDTQ